MNELASGVIFTDRDTTGAAAEFSMLGLTGPYWTPSHEEIAKLEQKLPMFLKGGGSPHGTTLVKKLDEYKRQYLGFTSSSGRTILVNAFCKEYWAAHPTWRNKVVVVFDGGRCFFRVFFGVASESFYGLEVNGES